MASCDRTANYDSLSEHQGKHPALMIFRRFLPLNARNLQLMQAELARLEDSLKVTIEDDRDSKDPKRSQYQYNIGLMKGPHDLLKDEAQWRKGQEVRKLLKEYSYSPEVTPVPSSDRSADSWPLIPDGFVLQVRALLQLAPVDRDDLSCLRELLENPRGSGRLFPQSLEYHTYNKKFEQDLTSLAGLQRNKDVLTRWSDRWIRTVYHKYIGHKYHDPISNAEAGVRQTDPFGVYSYSDSVITKTIDTLSTILASILPTIAALGIYLINDQVTRMAALICCTLLFSTTLTLFARPKRVEVFAASAAFAAVLVVFVGNSDGCGSGSTA
ncbi:hypothetical protein CLCR_06113 [Cladophialophora carrionii]|uniref:DUF6594 domain-containing protein n=1 Tax=Cladophialophora carrionii TaxID=86049 RepID=A0A1C1C8Z6_9EURO|nr:hypothetical protein CLCR_06113 [Cladophialophora carrionii]